METIKVIAKSNNWKGELPSEIDKKSFRDMVFQAIHYPGASLSIGKYTLSGTSLFHKCINGNATVKYASDEIKTSSFLWIRAKQAKSIMFHSAFEQVEYIVCNPKTKP